MGIFKCSSKPLTKETNDLFVRYHILPNIYNYILQNKNSQFVYTLVCSICNEDHIPLMKNYLEKTLIEIYGNDKPVDLNKKLPVDIQRKLKKHVKRANTMIKLYDTLNIDLDSISNSVLKYVSKDTNIIYNCFKIPRLFQITVTKNGIIIQHSGYYGCIDIHPYEARFASNLMFRGTLQISDNEITYATNKSKKELQDFFNDFISYKSSSVIEFARGFMETEDNKIDKLM